MASKLAQALIGQTPFNPIDNESGLMEDGFPIGYMYRPRIRKVVKDKKGRVVEETCHINEADDDTDEMEKDEPQKPIIPSSAKKVELPSKEEDTNVKSSATKDSPTEPIIPVSVALVAPDTTPDAIKPLDPSLVPALKIQPQAKAPEVPAAPAEEPKNDVMSMLLGKRNPAAATSAPSQVLPGIPTAESLGSYEAPTNPILAASAAKAKAAQVMETGNGMAEHVEGDIKRTMNVFRRFMG